MDPEKVHLKLATNVATLTHVARILDDVRRSATRKRHYAFRTMRKSRAKNLAVRVSDEELRMLHALAEDRGEPMSALVRRWTRDAYASRFVTLRGAKS